MNEKLFNELLEWQKSGNRSVDIKIEGKGDIRIFCYDSDLMAGQHIENSISELNLIQETIERKEKEIEKLRKLQEEQNNVNKSE